MRRKKENTNLAFSKKKRANAVVDGAIILIILFALGIGFMSIFQFYDDVKLDLDEDLTSETAQNISDDIHTRFPSMADGMLAMALVLLWIGSMALAFFIDTHPVFFVLSIILIIVVLVIAGEFSNTYDDVEDDLSVKSSFPITDFIFSHLVHFVLGFVFSIILALYAKSRL